MEFLKLAPSTWFEKGVGLADEFAPIWDAHGDGARVDVVESLVKNPVLCRVVDDERAIDRNRFGLDGREIGTEHGGVGMRMCKLDGPRWHTKDLLGWIVV